MSLQVHQVAISPDGDLIEIAYSNLPNDVRVGGQVVLMHTAQIDLRHPDYREDADFMVRCATKMLENCLEDWEESEPYVPAAAENDEEDGMGMGHGPES